MKMKIKPEDRPKMIGLLAAIGIMFCYLIFVVIPSLSGAQATPAAQETSGAAPVAPIATPVTPVNAPTSPAATSDNHNPIAMDAGPVPDAKTDPFLSPAPNPAPAAPSILPAVTATSKPASPPVTTPSPASAQITTQSVPKIPPPALSLLGVAGGSEQVAVFQVGESTVERKKGDTLPGGFRLETIDGDGVTLTQGKATCRLEVGHTFTAMGK